MTGRTSRRRALPMRTPFAPFALSVRTARLLPVLAAPRPTLCARRSQRSLCRPLTPALPA